MRTTLNIADEVLRAAKEKARRECRTTGAVISDLARIGLTSHPQAAPRAKTSHGFQPFPSRGVVVTNELIDVSAMTTRTEGALLDVNVLIPGAFVA